MTELIRVLIADDHSLVRAGFQSVLSIESDITVVGEARNGAEAVALARDEAPDVVLMDIRMPELDGLEATRLITSDPRLRRTRVVVLTTFDLDEYVFGALQAGASGFLLKGAEPAVLIEAVRTGKLPADRLESYNKLLRELRFQELKQDKRAKSEERQRWRVMNKAMRNASRPSRD